MVCLLSELSRQVISGCVSSSPSFMTSDKEKELTENVLRLPSAQTFLRGVAGREATVLSPRLL